MNGPLFACTQCPIRGILLTSRRQLPLPLSIAAALLFAFWLFLASPAPSYAVGLYTPTHFAVEGACSGENRPMPAKAILQRVVHRKPVPYMPHAHVPEYLLVYIVETLECGHKVTIYPQADALIALRRRCQNCAGGEVVSIQSAKKPSVSVSFSNPERKRA